MERKTLGLVIDTIASWGDRDYYQTRMILGVEEYCREHDLNFRLVIAGHLDSIYPWEATWNSNLELISQRTVDGLIILPSTIGVFSTRARVEEVVRALDPIPMIIVGDYLPPYPSVSVDNLGAMKTVVEHMINVHHKKRIAFIKGVPGNRDAEDRFQAYCQALDNHGLPFDPSLVFQGDFIFTSGVAAAKHFARTGAEFDALVAANDNMAVGALTEWDRLKKPSLPICGFDNSDGAKFYSLTTVHQHFRRQAQEAAKLLHQKILGQPIELQTLTPAELYIRNSCGCAHYPQRENDPPPRDNAASFLDLPEQLDKFLLSFESVSLREEFNDILIGMLPAFSALGESVSLESLVSLWEKFMRWAFRSGMNSFFLNSLIVMLKQAANRTDPTLDRRKLYDDFFQSAELQLYEKIETKSAFTLYDNNIIFEEIDYFGESLFKEIDRKMQMQIAYARLPDFGVDTCIVSRYPDAETTNAIALLSFVDGQLLEDGLTFDRNLLFPQAVNEEILKKRSSLVLLSLNCGTSKIGHMVCNFDEKNANKLERIRSRLSVGLESSLAIEKLEKTVCLRTKELLVSNEKLSKSLLENEMLLKELQHRVKNNLNVVISLLSLGESTTDNESAKKVLSEAKARIHTMTKIYEQLYRNPDIAADIDLSVYLNDLVPTIFDAYKLKTSDIRLELNLSRLTIDMKRSMSIGLMVNELVSNALKYAWPGRKTGLLRVSLTSTKDDFTLSVRDDGIGLPEQYAAGKSNSLGMSIVNMLVQDLCGQMTITNETGTEVLIRMPLKY